MKNTYAYSVTHKNGWGTGFGPKPTNCQGCGIVLVYISGDCCSPYGCKERETLATHPDAPELKQGETLTRSPAFCYDCCASDERQAMVETGNACLYLTQKQTGWYITDFTGVLTFPVSHHSRGHHNLARVRFDAWFTGPDGKPWHGTQYGENTQIIRCKRIKG